MPRSQGLPPAQAQAPEVARDARAAQQRSANPPRLIDSRSLLGDGGVVHILHEGLTYRLQATRLGKLILTK